MEHEKKEEASWPVYDAMQYVVEGFYSVGSWFWGSEEEKKEEPEKKEEEKEEEAPKLSPSKEQALREELLSVIHERRNRITLSSDSDEDEICKNLNYNPYLRY